MPISKDKKVEIFDNLKKIIKGSVSLVFVNFHRLPVSESSLMRKTLRGKGVGYIVAKKTLAKKALGESGFSGEAPDMPGELGIVYGTDLLDPAREIYEFQKKFDKKISIIGGIFEGEYKNQVDMMTIAQIPGMKTLQAQFVNLINSPIQGFVMALDQIAKKKA
ncbi:MAG: 50S ribosomal protein L10 [Candidatus Paceibacterota bacterium]|jgi:large subunit ribosomal protein L10